MECDPKGFNAQPDACRRLEVRKYPTWVVKGIRQEGVLSLDRLAEMSGFREAGQSAGGR